MKAYSIFNRAAFFLGTVGVVVIISVAFAGYMDRRANNSTTIKLETAYDDTEWIVVDTQEEYVVFIKEGEGYRSIAQIPMGELRPVNGDTTVWITVNGKLIESGYKIIRFTMKQRVAK